MAGKPSTPAVGQEFRAFKEGGLRLAPIRINLPNARNALNFQHATEGYIFGPFGEVDLNCVTYCAEVLRRGGVEGIPEDYDGIED